MATTQKTTPITLTLTDKAAVEVRKFMADEHASAETAGLRVAARPGRSRHRGVLCRGGRVRTGALRAPTGRQRLFPGAPRTAVVGADAVHRRDGDLGPHRHFRSRDRRAR